MNSTILYIYKYMGIYILGVAIYHLGWWPGGHHLDPTVPTWLGLTHPTDRATPTQLCVPDWATLLAHAPTPTLVILENGRRNLENDWACNKMTEYYSKMTEHYSKITDIFSRMADKIINGRVLNGWVHYSKEWLSNVAPRNGWALQ
jgi:hypothetical protein